MLTETASEIFFTELTTEPGWLSGERIGLTNGSFRVRVAPKFNIFGNGCEQGTYSLLLVALDLIRNYSFHELFDASYCIM